MKKEKLDWGDFPFRFFALLSVILGGAYAEKEVRGNAGENLAFFCRGK